MRRYLTLLLIMFFTKLDAQISTCNPNGPGITTNPAAPVNNQRPSKLNTFDWTQQNYPINLLYNYNNATSIKNPYYQSDNQYLSALSIPNDGLRDMYPFDGWELIKKDFGYEDNGTPSVPAAYRLYLILYNKYRGILRVFFARGDQQPYNGASVKLTFNNSTASLSSLLDYSAEVHALNDFPFYKLTNVPQITQVSPLISSPLVWFFADFPLMYDPCTCFYQSLFNVQLTLSSTSNISLSGNLNGTIVSQGYSNGGGTNYGVSQTNDQTLNTTRFGKLVTAFNGVDIFKSKSNDVAVAINVNGNGNVITGLDNLTNPNTGMKGFNFLKAGLSAIPYLGFAISLWDAIVGGGKSAPGPQQVEILPLSVNLGVNLSGSIVNDYTYSGSVFRTPGSDVSNAPDYAYAYYNEVLGVINLLKRPQIQILQYDRTSSYPPPGGNVKETYIKLSEPLQFVLNPASGVTISEIKGSYVANFLGIASGGYGSVHVDPEGASNFRTEYIDVKAMTNRELISRSTSWTGGDWPTSPMKIKFMINLERVNATANTQNILIVLTYPVDYSYSYTSNVNDVTSFTNTTAAASYTVDNATITSFCQSNAYKTPSRGLNYQREYEKNIKIMEDAEKKNHQSAYSENVGEGNSLTVFPNPATKLSVIKYHVKVPGKLKIAILDELGRNVETLQNADTQVGAYSLNWDLSNKVAGIYYVQMDNGNSKSVKKVIIMN